MFDTRDLNYQTGHLRNIISTQHYRAITDTRQLIFGQTINILQDELVNVLKRLLYIENTSLREVRALIPVGHGFTFKIKAVVKGLGIH